jgi:hypothetical protein
MQIRWSRKSCHCSSGLFGLQAVTTMGEIDVTGTQSIAQGGKHAELIGRPIGLAVRHHKPSPLVWNKVNRCIVWKLAPLGRVQSTEHGNAFQYGVVILMRGEGQGVEQLRRELATRSTLPSLASTGRFRQHQPIPCGFMRHGWSSFSPLWLTQDQHELVASFPAWKRCAPFPSWRSSTVDDEG